MDEEQLLTFITVAKEQNFTHAADHLYLSQPSVSKRIKTMERELGCDLFIRTDKIVRLTSEGKQFLPFAEKALESLNKGRLELKEKSLIWDLDRPIRIAAPNGLSLHYMPSLLNDFRSRYPKRPFDLYTKRSEAIVDSLMKEEIDLGIFTHRFALNKSLQFITLFEEQYTLLIHKDLLKPNKTFKLQDLTKHSAIRYNTGTFWMPIDEMNKQLNIEIHSMTHSDSGETIRRLVEAGIGYSYVPSYIAAQITKKEIYKAVEIEHIKLPSRPVILVFLKKNMRLAKMFLNSPKKLHRI